MHRDEGGQAVDVSDGLVLCGGHYPRHAVWRIYAGGEEVWRVGDQTEVAKVGNQMRGIGQHHDCNCYITSTLSGT